MISASAPAREFTSACRRKLKGELVSRAGDQVIVKAAAKESLIGVANLTVDDQQFIKEWVAANPGAICRCKRWRSPRRGGSRPR